MMNNVYDIIGSQWGKYPLVTQWALYIAGYKGSTDVDWNTYSLWKRMYLKMRGYAGAYTIEPQQDLVSYHSTEVECEMVDMIKQEIEVELVDESIDVIFEDDKIEVDGNILKNGGSYER
jgi:hypothetical protein